MSYKDEIGCNWFLQSPHVCWHKHISQEVGTHLVVLLVAGKSCSVGVWCQPKSREIRAKMGTHTQQLFLYIILHAIPLIPIVGG